MWWFYILLLAVVVLVAFWVSRSNLYRHWRGHGSDPGQRGTGRMPVDGDISSNVGHVDDGRGGSG